MAERVVDVLEVVEVDVEHRGRGGAAAAHFVDHAFQPLAEKDAVGQPAERIVQGEMAQLRFAGGDRLRRCARMWRSIRPASSAKPPIATAMNGRTLAAIWPPGWLGVQAKRGDRSRLAGRSTAVT